MQFTEPGSVIICAIRLIKFSQNRKTYIMIFERVFRMTLFLILPVGEEANIARK